MGPVPELWGRWCGHVCDEEFQASGFASSWIYEATLNQWQLSGSCTGSGPSSRFLQVRGEPKPPDGDRPSESSQNCSLPHAVSREAGKRFAADVWLQAAQRSCSGGSGCSHSDEALSGKTRRKTPRPAIEL